MYKYGDRTLITVYNHQLKIGLIPYLDVKSSAKIIKII